MITMDHEKFGLDHSIKPVNFPPGCTGEVDVYELNHNGYTVSRVFKARSPNMKTGFEKTNDSNIFKFNGSDCSMDGDDKKLYTFSDPIYLNTESGQDVTIDSTDDFSLDGLNEIMLKHKMYGIYIVTDSEQLTEELTERQIAPSNRNMVESTDDLWVWNMSGLNIYLHLSNKTKPLKGLNIVFLEDKDIYFSYYKSN